MISAFPYDALKREKLESWATITHIHTQIGFHTCPFRKVNFYRIFISSHSKNKQKQKRDQKKYVRERI